MGFTSSLVFLHGQYLRQPKPSSFTMQTRDFFFQIDAQQYTMAGILKFCQKIMFYPNTVFCTPTPWSMLLSVLGKNHIKFVLNQICGKQLRQHEGICMLLEKFLFSSTYLLSEEWESFEKFSIKFL